MNGTATQHHTALPGGALAAKAIPTITAVLSTMAVKTLPARYLTIFLSTGAY